MFGIVEWMPSNIQHMRFRNPQQCVQIIMGEYLGPRSGGRAAAAGNGQTQGFCRTLAVGQRGDEAGDHGVARADRRLHLNGGRLGEIAAIGPDQQCAVAPQGYTDILHPFLLYGARLLCHIFQRGELALTQQDSS